MIRAPRRRTMKQHGLNDLPDDAPILWYGGPYGPARRIPLRATVDRSHAGYQIKVNGENVEFFTSKQEVYASLIPEPGDTPEFLLYVMDMWISEMGGVEALAHCGDAWNPGSRLDMHAWHFGLHELPDTTYQVTAWLAVGNELPSHADRLGPLMSTAVATTTIPFLGPSLVTLADAMSRLTEALIKAQPDRARASANA